MRVKLNPRIWIPCAALFGVILYFGVRISAESSDGYKFLNQAVRNAPQVQSRLGQVEEVKLSYFGSLRIRAAGSDKWVTMTLNVVGQKGTATVIASAKGKGDVWTVTASSIDGEPISLN